MYFQGNVIVILIPHFQWIDYRRGYCIFLEFVPQLQWKNYFKFSSIWSL